MSDEYYSPYRIVLVGDEGVGKNILFQVLSEHRLIDSKSSIGVDFYRKISTIKTQDGPISCDLQIWDVSTQQRFKSIRQMYYKVAAGVIIIFDLSSRESFERLPPWIEEIRKKLRKKDVPLLLIGYNSAIYPNKAVSMEELNELTRTQDIHYMESSAKTFETEFDCFYIISCLIMGIDPSICCKKVVFNPVQEYIQSPTIPESTIPELELKYLDSLKQKERLSSKIMRDDLVKCLNLLHQIDEKLKDMLEENEKMINVF